MLFFEVYVVNNALFCVFFNLATPEYRIISVSGFFGGNSLNSLYSVLVVVGFWYCSAICALVFSWVCFAFVYFSRSDLANL